MAEKKPETLFRFSKIPMYISNGFAVTDGPHKKAFFVDGELTDIDLTPPARERTEPAGDWIADPARQCYCETIGEESVGFTVRRWTRAGEVIEYWLSAKNKVGGRDFFYAHRRGGWYMVVSCITGHPAVQTPWVDWSNSDGSTSFSPFIYGSVDELIAAAVATGRDFVRNQQH